MTDIDPDVLAQIERRAGDLRRLLDTRKTVATHITALETHAGPLVEITVKPEGALHFTTRVPVADLLVHQQVHLARLNARLQQLGAVAPLVVAPDPRPIAEIAKDILNG